MRSGRWLVPVLLVAVACGAPGSDRSTPEAPARASALTRVIGGAAPAPSSVMPTARPEPRHLASAYRAPAAQVDPGAGGELRIAALGIAAPVDRVGLDGTAMAVPDDARRVGWLRTTATAGDTIGASVISGHVSTRRDVPGAFGRLHSVRTGTVIRWTTRNGAVHRFAVVAVHRYPRTRGVPARLFRVDGPHRLYLVTCADRTVTSAGFHYRSNLVVTARELPRSTH